MTAIDAPEARQATPEFEALALRQERRRGFLLALPAWIYLFLFFAIPFGIVVVYSFATRTSRGGVALSAWNLASYERLGEDIVRNVLVRSLGLALLTTVICLVASYPFAYYMTTRSARVRNLMLVFVMIPFWTNFLVRNYAWRLILAEDGPWNTTADTLGIDSVTGWILDLPSWIAPDALVGWMADVPEPLFTKLAVVLGLVYSFLPFMILPLYASIERIDSALFEASRDLYASARQSFLRVLLPLSMPGVVAGSILVFVPSLGAYVTPDILGGGKEVLLGSYIVTQFGTARNFPFGASLSVVLMIVMLTATIGYFRSGGRNL